MKSALSILHGPMAREEIIELFEFVDLDDSKVIEYKEFLVALTVGRTWSCIIYYANMTYVGHVLHIHPVTSHSTKVSASSSSEAGTILMKKGSLEKIDGLSASMEDINIVLNLIVSAYLLFDPEGKGYISKNDVQGLIEEGTGKNSNAMLSQERWGEMVSGSSYLTPTPPQ